VETVADQQRYNYNLNPENRKRVQQNGLWAYSRRKHSRA
jgi:steroid 5-alpha reductase family enzyme